MLTRYTREDLLGDWQDLKAIWNRFRDDVLPIIEDFFFTSKHKWVKEHSGGWKRTGWEGKIVASGEINAPRMPTREEWKLLRKYFPLDGKGADPSQLTTEENRILVNYLEGAAEIPPYKVLSSLGVTSEESSVTPEVQNKQADLFRSRFNLMTNPNMLVTYEEPGRRSWIFPIPTVEEAKEALYGPRSSESPSKLPKSSE